MNTYIPYTYLIGWTKHNKWYYGVRYAKNCNTKDLWTKYFTSSKIVKKFRLENVEPDIIQIRKTFKHDFEAKKWEDNVLRRMKVHINEKFLNIRKDTFKGVIVTEEIRRKNGDAHRGQIPWNKGIKRPDLAEKMRKIRQERKDWGTIKGLNNEYRKENGLPLLKGRPKGSKDLKKRKPYCKGNQSCSTNLEK
jgi:hypothetical protein